MANDKGEIRLLVVEMSKTPSNEPDTVHMNTLAGAYDPTKGLPHGARALEPEERPEDLNEFVESVIYDTDELAKRLVAYHAKQVKLKEAAGEPVTPGELYVRLLSSFLTHPAELLGNMLATMMFDVIEQLLAEDNFEAAIAELEAD